MQRFGSSLRHDIVDLFVEAQFLGRSRSAGFSSDMICSIAFRPFLLPLLPEEKKVLRQMLVELREKSRAEQRKRRRAEHGPAQGMTRLRQNIVDELRTEPRVSRVARRLFLTSNFTLKACYWLDAHGYITLESRRVGNRDLWFGIVR